MTKLIQALAVGAMLAVGLTSTAIAEEKKAEPKAAAPAPASALKVGDPVYVCGCGGACHCGAISAEPGKCGCGHDLVKATVKKIEGTTLTVDRGGTQGETTFKAAYKCACGKQCTCNTVALKPGKCRCGADLVKVD